MLMNFIPGQQMALINYLFKRKPIFANGKVYALISQISTKGASTCTLFMVPLLDALHTAFPFFCFLT